jgi:hypothetical protein
LFTPSNLAFHSLLQYYARKVAVAVDAVEDVEEDVEGHNRHRREITGWE